ncbi:TadE/TadG family type IV pilus assembly protein [Pseudokordiimonas caeni]|uniref:TadE/TadG family type IV pilus assembly protein n=1 Tax=Pseudokordiimonas caeni TaxID=2997908 RepID=UPI002811FF0F|nr:pilus assembly protein [Pseudokordiimonas caeni]
MQKESSRLMKAMIRRLRRDEKGAIAVETGMILSILLIVGLGVFDYGLLAAHNMGLANAARSGMQYALVRKPQSGDFTAIINAVEKAAPAQTAAGDRQIDVSMYCRCPDDDTDVECTSEEGEDLSCPDATLRAAYIKVAISETYPMMFNIMGIADDIHLKEDVVARLN